MAVSALAMMKISTPVAAVCWYGKSWCCRCGARRATWLMLCVSYGESGDFGSCCCNELAVGVGVAMQAPTTVRRLGEEPPRPVGNARITRGLGNEPGEFRDHRKLLVSVKSSGIGEHLNADMRVAALHISQ